VDDSKQVVIRKSLESLPVPALAGAGA
jgi:hypothetical protein